MFLTIHYGSTAKDCQLTPPYRLLPTPPTVSDLTNPEIGMASVDGYLKQLTSDFVRMSQSRRLESADVHTDPLLGWDLVNLVQSVSIRRSAAKGQESAGSVLPTWFGSTIPFRDRDSGVRSSVGERVGAVIIGGREKMGGRALR